MSDVIVIGGGVIGTACAYYLAKAGRAVTLVERGRVGGACSHGNCGYVCPSHVLPLAMPGVIGSTLKALLQRNGPLKVRPGYALSQLGWFLGFARQCNAAAMMHAATGIQALLDDSRRRYDVLLADEAIACEFDTHGLLFVFQSAGAFHHYAGLNALLSDHFHRPAVRYDADALLQLEPALKPGAAAGGYLYTGDAMLRPDKLMAGWRAALTRLGVSVIEDCTVTGFAGEAGRARAVRTTRGEIAGTEFVVAAGAWSPTLNAVLGCKLPIVPGKGYSLTTTRPKVCPAYPMIFEEHRVAVSPFATGFRVGSTMEFSGYDETIDPKRVQLLRDGAAAYLREPEGDTVTETWQGFRPMVYDGKPVIDRSPALANVTVAAGHGMLGLSMATGTGKLVSDLLTHTPPAVDPAAYALSRF